ncbi:DBF4-type zinc finger-containing protein 2 [Elephas maximus indicus]|uniref:DBF4-type zinc finger-containing protein 2 n=1 Tax=Elephas maximus indicus TaxID=99487 RepID=UPI002116FF26|nr:DBF4-type zinc finger-containing protein 2 [Elephas maximus indicus]XP_049743920.1 DBF4-type zinc finger-containing protein 2 [Elephas maximus indicus]XP_049743921.1 DBF4-type zinc finger-containing protein 2 [Elephas maximus indicus]
MQSGQGYCSYCRVLYNNLEQHMFSAHHRNMATEKRMGSSSLMERFLQDVLRHHPYQYQESRSMHHERHLKNTVSPEVALFDDFVPEEMVKNTAGVRGDVPTKSFEELFSRPSKSQEYIKDISIRPSVIQKLEKGQQYTLKFVHKIGSNMQEFNPVDVDQATNNGQNVIRPPVISSAPPASRLSESSYHRPVISNATRLPVVAHLDSGNKYDPNKVDRYLEKPGNSFSNPVLSSHVETSSVSYPEPKESTTKSLSINSGKLILQEGVNPQGKTLSAGFKFHEFMDTEGPLRSESLSKLAVNSAANLDKINISSNKGISEDAIPKNHEELFSNMDHTQEEKHMFFNKSSVLEQKSSVCSEMKFDCRSLHSVSDQPQEAVQDLNPWKEEQVDPGDKNCESRGFEMSFNCSSSFLSLTDQSEVTAKEINLPVEEHADLQYKNNKSCASEVSSDSDGSLQFITSQPQVTVKETSLQKSVNISLVDQSYESGSSEIDFHCDTSLQPIIVHPQQSVKDRNLPMEMHTGLVDKNYGSSSSETSADSAFPLEAVVDRLPSAVKEIKLQKKVHIGLVDKNYESSCSETSFDCEFSPQSVVDHCQLAVEGGNLKERHVDLEDKNCKPSGVKACLDCDGSLQIVTDESKRAVEEINILREKNADLVDKNCEYHGPKMSFHGDTQIMADQSEVTVKEVKPQELDTDLEKKSDEPSISDLSFDSEASLCWSSNDQRQGALDEINLKELNVDMEIKSYDCSSSELTFDSDPLLAVTEQSRLDFEEIKDHIKLQDKNFESNSSDITFESDISLQSVVDQPQVTVYEEEYVDLENKSNASCVSDITFDSDIPVHSDTEQSEVAVKERTIQEEEHVHLERKSDESTGSEISLDSGIPLHSVTNPTNVAIKKLNLQKEEQLNLENKGNEPRGLELSSDYDDTFYSVTDCSEVSVDERNLEKNAQAYLETKGNRPTVSEMSLESDIPLHLAIDHSVIADKEVNLQKEEHVHLETKGREFRVSEISWKSDIPLHLITDHTDIAVKDINHQKEEHVRLGNKSNDFTLADTKLDSGMPVKSVICQPEVVVEKTHLQNEKHADLEGKSAECSGSELILDSDIPHYLVTEPQTCIKKTNIQKEERVALENKSDDCSRSEIALDSDVSLRSRTQKLVEDRVDPEDESTESRGFGISLGVDAPFHFMTDRPHLTLLKEKCVDLENKNSESSGSKISFDSHYPLQALAEQIQEAIKKINLWKEEHIGLGNKIDEPNGSKLIHNSDVSPQAAADQPEVVVKQTNLEKEDHVYLEDKDSQSSGSEMSLDSDFLLQSIIDQPQITILEQEHIELEDKHDQSCGSEISFDSDDPLQSVADQLQKAVKEISLWEDEEVNTEDKRRESGSYEIAYDSDVLPSAAGQTEEVLKEVNLWKKHVDLEDKIVKPSGSKITCGSDKPLHSVADEIQEAVKERNLREENVYLDNKGYELNGSGVIRSSNVPIQPVVEQLHILEQEHANLEDKSNDACGPEISFDSDNPIQPVDDQLQKAVKETSLWKEDRIYLEDKSYKLGDFEVTYNSDVSIQFVGDQSPVAVKEISFQKKDHNDLENKNYKSIASEIKFDSGVHFQIDVDQPQVACKETDFQKEKHLGMEEKTSEPSDSEMICVSDVPLQIVVNPSQGSVKETNLHEVVYLNLVTSDSDCEIISDSDTPFQSVTDQPQMTVKETNCINEDCIGVEDESCDSSCDSEMRYVCEGSPQSVTNQSKEIFKLVNQKGDYIILEDLSCDPCGSEIEFNANVSHQSMSYHSQRPYKKMKKYIGSEDKSCGSRGPKRKFNWENSSQSVTDQVQKATKKVNLQKNLGDAGLKNQSCESSTSATDYDSSPESVIYEMADKENSLKLKHTDLESISCEPYDPEMNLQCDPSLQCDSDQPNEAVNKIDLFETISFDLKDNHDTYSSSVSMVNPLSNLEKTKRIAEDNFDEPVLEDLPHVPPSFVGKTWSQIMREDDVKINALVKEFKEGRFHCYFDDDCETRTIKKNTSNEGKKVTWADLNQKTTSVQVLSDCDDIEGDVLDIDDFSMALDKPCLHSKAKRPYKQKWHMAPRCQTVKVSHGTQTNFNSYPVMKREIIRQEEDAPKRKRLRLQNDKITTKEMGTIEFPESRTEVLKPLQPNALVYVLSSPNTKPKEDESLSFSEMGQNSWDNIQYKYKQSSIRYYDPLTKQTVIDPPNTVVPESDSDNWVKIHFNRSDPDCRAQENDAYIQSSASASFTAVPVRYGYELKSHQEASGSSVFLEGSEILNSSDVPKESNFHLTLLNPDAAQVSAKSGRNEFLESKSKKMWRRKVTANDKPIVLQQKDRITSEKQPIWSRTKPGDIIRKYIPKYSAFLRHRYQSKNISIGMNLQKKKSEVRRQKKVKRPDQILSNSVPSAGAEEQFGAMARSAPKQPVQDPSRVAGRKMNRNKNRLRTQKQPSEPVKVYDLRSLSSQIPQSDRVKTRLSNRLSGNKVN